MATRSRIGKRLPDGKVKSIYCHWDGYPEHNGRILLEHYTDESKVDELLGLGDISSLGSEIGEKHSFGKYGTDQCTAYHRDRGEKLKVRESNFDQFLDQEFHYLFEDGKWKCYTSSGHELVLKK